MAYRKFYNFLAKCQSLTDGRNWNLFHSPDMLCTLISKLPMSVGDRWDRRVQFTRKNLLREPYLSDFIFIKFVDEETELVDNPWYSREAVDQHTERTERERKSFSKRDRRFKMVAVQLEENSKDKSLRIQRIFYCVMCAKIHELEQCKACLTESVDVRRSIYQLRNCVMDSWNQYTNPYGKEL